jgi:hypothetical protein
MLGEVIDAKMERPPRFYASGAVRKNHTVAKMPKKREPQAL